MTRRRRQPGIWPVIALIVLSMVPVVLFAGVWRWAEDRKTATVADPPVNTTPLPVAPATPVMSLRRAPQTMVSTMSETALRTALADVAGLVPEGSCMVVAVDGQTIYDDGGDTPVTPASNQKLLVAAVALENLGPDFTYSTRLMGAVDGNAVVGDLYFVGGGDPLLSTAAYPATQQYPPTSVTSIEALVANLAALGITRINGNVITDESRYDAERYVPTWSEGIAGVEAGPLSALLVNDALNPNNGGRYNEPHVGAGRELVRQLRNAGITVNGSAQAGVTPPEAVEITSIQSAPLSAIVAEMLTTSDDNTAELMLKELGVDAGVGGTRQAGVDAILGTLTTWGIDTARLSLIDGSGLDSNNIVTCNVLLDVLQRQPVGGPLDVGLPVAAQSGTLTAEFVGTSMAGRIRAKTGTLSSAKALSGYVTTVAGRIEFSLILDYPNVKDNYSGIWVAFGNALAPYPMGPTLEQVVPR